MTADPDPDNEQEVLIETAGPRSAETISAPRHSKRVNKPISSSPDSPTSLLQGNIVNKGQSCKKRRDLKSTGI